MAAVAAERRVEEARRRHNSSAAPRHHARRDPRPDVQPIHPFDPRRRLEHALAHHHHPAGAALLGRLEDELHRPVERRLARLEHFRRREQHRRVRVVAARVHLPGRLALEVALHVLVDRQRVHVGAQRDARRLAAAERRDDPLPRHRPLVRDLELVERGAHERRRLVELVQQLGRRVELAPHADRPIEIGARLAEELGGRDGGEREEQHRFVALRSTGSWRPQRARQGSVPRAPLCPAPPSVTVLARRRARRGFMLYSNPHRD